MTIEFRRVSVDEGTLHAYSKLLKSVFSDEKKFDVDALRWRYKDNPDGEAIGFDAFDGEELVAHYVTTPVTAIVNGSIQRGLLSLNTAVHEKYRGKNLFPVISKNTFELAKELNFDFVIGVANGNSTKIFIKRLGFQLVTPLKTGFFLRLKWSYKPADFEMVRNDKWLDWRLSNPAQPYFVKGKKGGVFVSTPTHMKFIHCFSFLKNSTFKNFSIFFPKIYLYMGLDNGLNFDSPLFFPIPEKYKPSPLNLIYKSLNEKTPTLTKSINFSFLDFDPY